MKKRVWGVLATVSIIAVAFAGTIVGVAAIQDYRENKGDSFVERVPSLIGMEKETVPSAVAKTTKETDEESAAELKDRRLEPPEVSRSDDSHSFDESPFSERRDFDEGLERFDDFPFERFEFGSLDRTEWLDELVERGFMTQEDAEELKSWFNNLPESFGEGMPDFPSQRNFEFDRDDGRFRFRGHWRWSDSEDDDSSDGEPRGNHDPNNGISFSNPI